MNTAFEARPPRGGTGVLVLRLLVAVLVGALGVALLMSGHVLIGGLILALAVVRLALAVAMRHRHNQWGQARDGYRRPGQPTYAGPTYPGPTYPGRSHPGPTFPAPRS